MADPDTRAFDVAVVGAGPAGSSAASALARAGATVLILEKASLPRYKTCGGGLVHRARRLLPDAVRTVVERECHAAELNSPPHGLHLVTERAEPIISMTMRSDLDHHLVSEARRAGAHLHEACVVKSVRTTNDGVALETSKGLVCARFVVGADGAGSTVAKQAGWPESPAQIPALECEVFVRESDFTRLSQTARFDFGVIPHGYAWVFPKKEHLSIGVLSMRRGRVNLHETLGQYLALLGLHQPAKVERHGHVIPIRPRPGGLARGRVLLAGDAAGLVDPVTAEGITYAIRSGQLAAQALFESAFDALKVAPRYQALVRREISAELNAGKLLAWVLYQQPRLAAWLLRRHGRALSELMTDVVMGQRTYRNALRKPVHYLRLLKVLRSWSPARSAG